ncbi:hypothetical protein HanRHA438_Chr04g0185471 [Helianthus annuus]|nr:hypothetical protein HanRHA438_Chr04g0185471 [Helianthus annuus]
MCIYNIIYIQLHHQAGSSEVETEAWVSSACVSQTLHLQTGHTLKQTKREQVAFKCAYKLIIVI